MSGLFVENMQQSVPYISSDGKTSFLIKSKVVMMGNTVFRIVSAIQRPEVSSLFRISILRSIGVKIGANSSIGSGVHILTSAISVGNNVRIGAGSRIDNFAHIEIGDWVRFGSEVLLETGTHKIIDAGPFRRTVGDENYKPITIERGCMIYARAIILPGVTIREGCVIGAGSIIDRDTIPNGLYVGNRPREPIKIYKIS
ncbi:acyltransferase [Methylobacterium sp. WL69]|nr:acyltransferase [Methylobacterium sp. WL69]